MTRALPQARPPIGDRRRAIERARELAEAAATVETLAAYLGIGTQHPGRFFFIAYGAAIDRLRDLLASIDEAGTRHVGPGGDPPHDYVPAGPVETAPYLGYCRPEIRREAFAAVLDDVETGTYDLRIVAWLTQWDDTTCRTIASLMWRCRLAGAVAASDAETVRQALAEASAWRTWRAEGAGWEASALVDPGRCSDHALDEQVAAGYDSLLRRLTAEGDSL